MEDLKSILAGTGGVLFQGGPQGRHQRAAAAGDVPDFARRGAGGARAGGLTRLRFEGRIELPRWTRADLTPPGGGATLISANQRSERTGAFPEPVSSPVRGLRGLFRALGAPSSSAATRHHASRAASCRNHGYVLPDLADNIGGLAHCTSSLLDRLGNLPRQGRPRRNTLSGPAQLFAFPDVKQPGAAAGSDPHDSRNTIAVFSDFRNKQIPRACSAATPFEASGPKPSSGLLNRIASCIMMPLR